MNENNEGPQIPNSDSFRETQANSNKKKDTVELAADFIGIKKPGDHVVAVVESVNEDGKKVVNVSRRGVSRPDRLVEDAKNAWKKGQEEKNKYTE